MRTRMVQSLVFLGMVMLGGCSGQTGYEKAFSQKSALSGNSKEFDAGADAAFRTVKITLVQQGFTIEQVDVAAGLIKAVRSLQDPQKPKYAYLITTTVDITAQPSGRSTTITIAASQQTVLHKDSEKYFHLLGLVPIPTGRNYQTVVTKEGNIDKAGFYTDFFAAVNKNLPSAGMAPPAATATALPASTGESAPTAVNEPASGPASTPSPSSPAAATVTAPIAAAPQPAAMPNSAVLAPLEP